jgi:hypothetical protein
MRVALSMDRMVEQYFQKCIETEFEFRKPGDTVDFICNDPRLFELLADHAKNLLANAKSAKYQNGHPRSFRWNTLIKARIRTFRLDIFPPDKVMVMMIE